MYAQILVLLWQILEMLLTHRNQITHAPQKQST